MITRPKFHSLLLILFASFIFSDPVVGKVTLPKLISDGMVLQRNVQNNIWGWAESGEEVTVKFHNKRYNVKADKEGEWSIKLSPMKAGGPYIMKISGENSISLKNIYIGEVWVSSGQSNMELPMRRVKPLYKEEMANAKNEHIRFFKVPNHYSFQQPQKNLESGSWLNTSPETIANFSAVAYFFAKELQKKYDVPVGIINSSLGGSPAQAWISEDALKGQFPQYYEEAQRFKSDSLISNIQQQDQKKSSDWYALLNKKDDGLKGVKSWYDPEVNTDDWATMNVPGYWADTNLGETNGSVWFRKTIEVSAEMAHQPATLNMGRIVDADSIFINGELFGNTTYQYPPRWYDVPAGVLKEGENTIAIRVINSSGRGGFVLDKPYRLTTAKDTISLKGNWRYKLGTQMQSLEPQIFIRWKPAGLFNAMIAPLLNYNIKGVIWYQGESNTGKAEEYQELFSLMIENWRSEWNQDKCPFLYVQLANFMETKDQPGESDWAALREAQRKTLSVPNTAMAVAIDIGEWNDIHPLNKKEVGHRLALGAQKIAYDDDVVYSGPTIKSMNIEGQKMVLRFSNTGSGLVAKGDSLGGFAIAGPDHDFVWANAKIDGDNVIVWSGEIENPTRVRYGWADNPVNANLYNKEGLPASPFESGK